MNDTDRNNAIATKLRELADLFHGVAQGAGPATNPVAITAEQVDACKDPAVAAKDKAKRATKAKATPAPKDEDAPAEDTPEMTPAEIAADLKAKLVALVGKDRAKAVSLLGTIGAKNFSSIPVEKHAEMLRKVDAALNPAASDDDPLA